jgi:2-polyprenyl-6-hydroxyphenyl methylase/3-demethylubiquinone-9 3-methyltransferase
LPSSSPEPTDSDYYCRALAGERLRRVYDVASPRVRQYLDAELGHVVAHLGPEDVVLELGCGYGRVLPALAAGCQLVIGIDTSRPSIELGRRLLAGVANCRLFEMNALDLSFPDGFFDRVVCIQNGISAFHVDQGRLLREALRVTRPGGRALFSSYAAAFWPHRLDWFRLQAQAGLIGELDEAKTRDGVIVCRDGFTASTVSPGQFRAIAEGLCSEVRVTAVDDSSLFCELTR